MATVAMTAIQRRDIETLSNCIEECEVKDDLWLLCSGVNLLEYAVEENFVCAVRLLISIMPSGPPYTDIVRQAFVVAMRKDSKDIVRLFLDAALNSRPGMMTLCDVFTYAVHRELEDIAMQVLKRSDFDYNCEEPWDGERPLSIAIFWRRFHLAERLIGGGAVVDAPNNRGETALVTACRLRFGDCCRGLLLHGASPNHQPLHGLSPLRACCSGFSKDLQELDDIVAHLLNAGLNVNRESWIQAEPFATNSALYGGLRHLGRQPRSLRLLCCVTIRDHLTYVHHGISILNFLFRLPLPLPLKKYVSLRIDD